MIMKNTHIVCIHHVGDLISFPQPSSRKFFQNFISFFSSQGLRGSYWVLYNYIRGEKKFQVAQDFLILQQKTRKNGLSLKLPISSVMSQWPIRPTEISPSWTTLNRCSRGNLIVIIIIIVIILIIVIVLIIIVVMLKVGGSNLNSCVRARQRFGGCNRLNPLSQVPSSLSAWSHQANFRDCTNSSLVRDLATFHVFFDFAHTPAQVFSLFSSLICLFVCRFSS